MSATENKMRLGYLLPSGSTREGRMLAAGRLTLTVTSKKTGAHLTLRLHAKAKDESIGAGTLWKTVPFAEATHVFVEDFDGEKIATYYPASGVLFFSDRASAPARWATEKLLRYLGGAYPKLPEQAELFAADICGKCGQPLTDPESIERGLGPVCFGAATNSKATPALV